MNVRAWSVSLLLFLSTVTAVGQTVNRYLNTPLPKEWEESGEVFQQTLPVDDHWWKSFLDTMDPTGNQWKYQYLTSVYRSLLRCCTQYELGNRCLRQYP